MHIKNNKLLQLLFIAIFSRIIIFLFAYIYLDGINFPYSLCQWDAGWYLSIINNGYDNFPHGYQNGDVANWPYFPLFPILAILFKFLFGLNSSLSSFLLNNILFIVFVTLLFLYIKPLIGEHRSFKGVSAFCFLPFTLYLSVPYSESLFLVLLFTSLYFLNKKRYILFTLSGMLLAVTRNNGVFLVIILFIHILNEYFSCKDKSAYINNRIPTFLLSALLLPIFFELFSLYLYFKTGDALAFVHIERGFGRTVGSNPISTIISIFNYPYPYTTYCLFALLIGLISSIWMVNNKMIGEALFSVIPFYLNIATGNISSMARYSFLSLSFITFFIFQYSKLSVLYYLIGIVIMACFFSFYIFFWINANGFMI